MKNENYETCKRIADELREYYEGGAYICPECGEVIKIDFDENGEAICPECGETISEDWTDPVSLWDYFDDCLDIEYRIGGDRELRSVCIMVACGGPNIYIDTGNKKVELYWWTETASAPIDCDVCEAIEEIFEDIYSC